MSTARVFDALWSRYDAWYERRRVTFENEVKAAGEALRGAPRPCLELGVGTGRFASRLGCEYGVDPSPAMARAARARGVEVAVAAGEALPLRSGSLGSILIVVTLCFLDDPKASLAEAARALRPGGRLVACIVPADSPWGRHYQRLAREGHPFYSHATLYTVGEAASLIASAGLRVEGVLGTLTYPPGAPERPEDPEPYKPGLHGFACIRAAKPAGRG